MEKNKQNVTESSQETNSGHQKQSEPSKSGPKGMGWQPSTVSQPFVPEPPVQKPVAPVQPGRTRTALRVVLTLVLAPIILFMSMGVLENMRWLPESLADVVIFLVLDILAVFALIQVWKRGSKSTAAGEARGIQSRQEADLSGTSWTVLSFVLERYDKNGNRLTPVPVEMRGRSFKGFLNEGDWVEVHGTLKKGKTLRVSQVYNKTTESTVKAKGESAAVKAGSAVITIIALAIIIPIVLFVLAFIWSLISGY
ncbi:MAG: hypothetical protein HXS48_16455 [Theionarchaea archaeon]|nr:hypothetical protein [Theionarchaea archaeon]